MANELIEAASRHLAPYAAGPVATIEDAPQNEIRVGLIIAGLFFVLFLGWAAFARMDAAAYAGGRVTVSGQRQTVQHRAQVGEQGQGYERQLVAINEQERIISEQLESMRTVAEKGFVSRNRIRDLERAQADLIGQRGRLQASIASSGESVGESRLRIVETERTYQDKIATDLREAEFSLGELMP